MKSENSRSLCPDCGRPLPSHPLPCPHCSFADALDEAPGASVDVAMTDRFGDFELLERIDHGGMGVVYRARQRSLNRIVALKLILAGRHASDEARHRFRAEAEAAAGLKHPNIVAIHQVGELDGQPFFSMDYVEGTDLAKHTLDRPLEPRKAATILRKLAAAVQHAHQKGILHRDLKPSNILIDRLGEPHLTDFGLAKRLDGQGDMTLTGQVLGSPSFISPEQAAGRVREVTTATDVYSLGALLYQLLTGRPPFNADTLPATLQAVIHSPPKRPTQLLADLPADLETICLKCLEKEPDRRYRSALEVGEDLDRFLAGEPVAARPLGKFQRGWRWCRRRPVIAALTAGLVIAILSLAIGSTVALLRVRASERQMLRESYSADLARALDLIENGQIAEARQRLLSCPEEFRHWEWGHLNHKRPPTCLPPRRRKPHPGDRFQSG